MDREMRSIQPYPIGARFNIPRYANHEHASFPLRVRTSESPPVALQGLPPAQSALADFLPSIFIKTVQFTTTMVNLATSVLHPRASYNLFGQCWPESFRIIIM